MAKIKKIGVKSLAKILGVTYAVMGFIGGLFFTIMFVFNGTDGFDVKSMAFILGIGAPIFLPIFYGILGFLAGLVTAWLYNLMARWVGGVELEIE